jgi:DNA-binding CsgD family transcriptional regulator
MDGGPSSNIVGFFRLPGSYNTKAQCYSSVAVIHDVRYDQRDLTRLEAPEIRTNENATTKYVPFLETDREVIENYESTGVRRVIQMIKLRNLRDNKVGEESRDLFNFTVYNALRMTYEHDAAMARLRAFNEGFKEPMTDAELEVTVCAAKTRGGYKYTNEGLIELLEVTPEEQQVIGLFPARGFRRSKPNASRDEARKTLKEDRDNKILALIKKGVSQVETARILGIGKNTVWRVVKRLKEAVEIIMPQPKIEESGRHQNGSIYVLGDPATVVPSPAIPSGGEGVFVMRLLKEGG